MAEFCRDYLLEAGLPSSETSAPESSWERGVSKPRNAFVYVRDLRGFIQIKSHGFRATRPSSFEASGASLKSSLAASQNSFRLIL